MSYNFSSGLGSQGPGYVYDMDNSDEPPSFPDVPELLDNVNNVLEYMCTSEVKELRKGDKECFQAHMEQRFPDFSFKHYNLFVKLLSGEDISPLLTMLGVIQKVKSGELSMEDAERYVGEGLAKKYVLPKLDKKNKKNK